jgi:hypothetical protein
VDAVALVGCIAGVFIAAAAVGFGVGSGVATLATQETRLAPPVNAIKFRKPRRDTFFTIIFSYFYFDMNSWVISIYFQNNTRPL